MGQKSNPIILRLNKTNQHWNSCWYSDYDYATPFIEDCKINAYVNSSQQQLERFPALSFVKRQRGDLQIALFSAKGAQQFSKFKYNRYKNFTSNLITHNIYKKWVNYKRSIHKEDTFPDTFLGYTHESNLSLSTKSLGIRIVIAKKKEYFKSQLFLAMGCLYSNPHALKAVIDNMRKKGVPSFTKMVNIPYMLSKETPFSLVKGGPNPFTTRSPTINKGLGVKIVDATRNHLEYSIYKYYNNYNVLFSPIRSKLYLVKSPSIYQNPLFLASQLVSLLEERAFFRQIKHRVVREIRKNPIIKGVRIVCSGRVASRSKKAQKARRESIQWGATSLNVFSEHVNFAHSFAQTTFGKIGVKVWISYNLIAH